MIDLDAPRVVGLDLSLTATGIAMPDGATATLATKTKGVIRLAHLRDHILTAVIDLHRFGRDTIVMEDYAYSRGNQAHQVGELGGVVRVALWEAGIPFAVVGTGQLKKYATGRGNATKVDMGVAAMKRAGLEFTDDNQCDAWWLRAMGMDALGHPIVAMPAVNRAALDKVAWPKIASGGGGPEDSTTASERPATTEPPTAPSAAGSSVEAPAS